MWPRGIRERPHRDWNISPTADLPLALLQLAKRLLTTLPTTTPLSGFASMVERISSPNLCGFTVAGLSPDEAYSKIDAEISRWGEYVRNLKTLRNSFAPVSRVPNEVLSTILYLACLFSRDSLHSRLYLCRVCSRWRDVALADPQFWRTIKNHPSVPGLPYIQDCLDRSKSLTLEMDLRPPYPRVLSLCMSRLSRISSLTYVSSKETPGVACPPKFLSQPAPQLSSLSMTKTVLVKDPFNGVRPELKHLKLDRCKFDWSFPLSISLTTLHIVSPPNLIPISLLAIKLFSMPSLASLYLKNCLTDPESPTATTQYILPSLRTLALDDHQGHVFDLMNAIRTPVISSLTTCILAESFGEAELLDVLDLFQAFHPALWSNIRHLVLRPLSIELEGSSPASRGIIEIRSRIVSCTMLSACNQLALHRLETLSVDEAFKGLTRIAGILRSLRNVWHLRFSSPRHKVALDLLAAGVKEDGQTDISLPLPALTEVHCDAPFAALYEVLKQRQEILKSRLPNLTFRKCTPADVDKYSELADLIVKDGFVSVEGLDAEPEW